MDLAPLTAPAESPSQSQTSNMAPSSHVPNVIKSDPNERLPDLNRQLDDSLAEVFKSSSPSKPAQNRREEVEAIESENSNQVDDDNGQSNASHEKEKQAETSKTAAKTEANEKTQTKPATSTLVDPATVADPKNLGKSSDGWKTLKGIASKNFEVANQRAQELDTVKKSFATKEADYKKQIETFQKQISELNGYRAAVDVQADPEFISKYEEPMGKLQKELTSMLRSQGVNDQIISQIDFEDSARMATVLSAIEENSDKIFSKRFARRVEDLLEVSDRRKEALEDWQKNSKTFMEERKKEALGKRAQAEGQMLKLVDDYTNEKNEDGTPRIPFLSKQEAPAGANKEQIKAVEVHNTLVDEMNQKLHGMIKNDDPKDKVEVAIAALAAQWIKWQLDDTTKKLEAAQSELKRISSAGNEGESRTTSAARESERPSITNPKSLDLDNALESHFGRRS